MKPKKPKHTPGPWRVGDAAVTVFGPKIVGPAPAETIATSIRNRANAHLIAAAPEMLDALEHAAIVLKARGDTGKDIGAMFTYLHVNNVLKKARGES